MTQSNAELDELLGRLLHCQKIVNFGHKNWERYSDELNTLRLETIPAYIADKERLARVDEVKEFLYLYDEQPKYKGSGGPGIRVWQFKERLAQLQQKGKQE